VAAIHVLEGQYDPPTFVKRPEQARCWCGSREGGHDLCLTTVHERCVRIGLLADSFDEDAATIVESKSRG
jgi:hypothetical protein